MSVHDTALAILRRQAEVMSRTSQAYDGYARASKNPSYSETCRRIADGKAAELADVEASIRALEGATCRC